jgi:hypothetical protein
MQLPHGNPLNRRGAAPQGSNDGRTSLPPARHHAAAKDTQAWPGKSAQEHHTGCTQPGESVVSVAHCLITTRV